FSGGAGLCWLDPSKRIYTDMQSRWAFAALWLQDDPYGKVFSVAQIIPHCSFYPSINFGGKCVFRLFAIRKGLLKRCNSLVAEFVKIGIPGTVFHLFPNLILRPGPY